MNRTLIGFLRKELTQSLRDPQMKGLLFIAPMVQMTLFGVAVSSEVKNVRLAAIIAPQDTILRRTYERATTGGWLVPVTPQHGADPFKWIQGGETDAVLVPPPGGLTRALGRGTATLQLLTDATNVLQAQAVENYVRTNLLATIREDLKISAPEPPIHLDVRVLYNPSLDTTIFMVPGVMCTLLVMTTMMLSMAAIVREKERGTFEMLISAPVSPSEVIFGKTLPYVVLGMLNLPLVMSVAIFIFGVPLRGSLLVLCGAALVFVCTCVALGTLVSTFCQNQQQSALASFLIMFPAIMFSGLMFPLENMPAPLRMIAYLDPLAHYLGLLRNIMLKGGGAGYVTLHVGVLAVMAVVFTLISFRRFRTTLR